MHIIYINGEAKHSLYKRSQAMVFICYLERKFKHEPMDIAVKYEKQE